MSIWKKKVTIEQMNLRSKDTLMETLGVRFTAIGDDFLQATMPVDKRVHQPYGLLHGGASVGLAESLGSFASILALEENDDRWCVGIEINANHVRSVSSGIVTGTVRPLYVGHTQHVWEIKITDPRDRLVCERV